MTEAEWMCSTSPQAMLECIFYHDANPLIRRASPRQLRLFTCAVCRAVWDGTKCVRCTGLGKLHSFDPYKMEADEYDCPKCHGSGKVVGLTDPRSRNAVAVAERFADGLATEAEFTQAQDDADKVSKWPGEALGQYQRTWSTERQTWWLSRSCLLGPLQAAQQAILTELPNPAMQAALLREIFGNPWELARLEKKWTEESWQRWLTPTVLAIARKIYDRNDWASMPILADCLEEVGCTDMSIINHCRTEQKHVRGCWAIDSILGRS